MKLSSVPFEVWYAVVVVGLLAVVFRVIGGGAARNKAALLEIAARLGLRFVERMEGVPVPPLLLEPDPQRTAGFTLAGTHAGLEVTVFGLLYKDPLSTYQTLFAFRLPGATVPAFLATPETLNERVAAATGAQDVDFADDAEFSKAFWLRGDPRRRTPEDERALRELFAPEVRRALLSARPVSVGGWEDRVVVWTRNHDVAPEQIPARLASTAELARRFFQRSAKPPGAG